LQAIVLGELRDFMRYFWIMRVTRLNAQELVVVDGAVGLSVVLFAASLPLLYVATRPGKIGALFGACLFLLGAIICLRKTTFTFDAGEQRVRWHGRKVLKVESGVIPFGEITGIGTETSLGADANTYRLTILTRSGLVPLAYTFGGNKEKYASMREEILRFLHPEVPASAPDVGSALPSAAQTIDEASVRSLLSQGRKIDAVSLVRTSTHLGLTEAVQLVEEIDQKMKTG
jgi:hypothetical protein